MGYSLGIDVGTTSVAAAVCDGATLEIVSLGDRSARIPAAVYRRGSDGALLVGEHAASRTVSSPSRVTRDLKRRLGDPAPVLLGDQAYPVGALLAELLGQVVRTVTDRYDAPPDRVMLTCPASWDGARRALLTDVAQRAGLTEPLLVTDAEAAAAHHVATEGLAEGHTLTVYDLGGGCFDATVLRVGRDGLEVLGMPHGVDFLGGIDFDEALLRYVDGKTDHALSSLDPNDPRALPTIARARQDCRVAKETLSVDARTVVPVHLQSGYVEIRVRRSEFEELIREQLDTTVTKLAGAVRSAAVEPAQVLLAGGSTHIPLVTKLVSAAVPSPVRSSPTHGVALGAARLAWQSTGQVARPVLVTAPAATTGARHRRPEPADHPDADPTASERPPRRPPELWAGALLLTLAILPVAILGLALILRPIPSGLDIWRQFTGVELIGDLGTLATVFRGIGILLTTLGVSFTALAWLSALPRRGARTITTGLVVIEILALVLVMNRLRPAPLTIAMLVLAAAGIVLVYLPRVGRFRRHARQRELQLQQQRSTG